MSLKIKIKRQIDSKFFIFDTLTHLVQALIYVEV